MSHAGTFAVSVILLAAAATAARADTFTYSYYRDAGDFFNVTTPTLVTANGYYTSPDLSCSVFGYNQCRFVQLNPVQGSATWYANFNRTDINEGIFIPPADFLAPGVYQVPNAGTFYITDNPTSVTPEPSSWILLATASFGFVLTQARKSRTT